MNTVRKDHPPRAAQLFHMESPMKQVREDWRQSWLGDIYAGSLGMLALSAGFYAFYELILKHFIH